MPTNLLKMPKLGPRFRKTSARDYSEGTDTTDAPITNTPDPFYRFKKKPRFRKGEMISIWGT